MSTLALVSCGKGKRAERSKARDLYIGDLFVKTRDYVERNYDNWIILSALHGPISPDKEIEPYDYTLLGKDHNEQKEWAEQIFQFITNSYSKNTSIKLFAGREYRKYIQPLLEEAGYVVEVPLKGLGIGQQKSWLKGRLGA
jgi:cytoplasmic iron level regulating protein YaaA (DUF328/UPF0246 family)